MISYENIITMKDMIREYARLVEEHKAAEIDAACCQTAHDRRRLREAEDARSEYEDKLDAFIDEAVK